MANRKGKSGGEISYDTVRKISGDPQSKVHFIGVGGVSMYSLARLTLYRGSSVSGSDREESLRTEELSLLGADISIGHSPENTDGADLVVYSSAIADSNPELMMAREQGILTLSRAEYLGALMLDYSGRIGVSGSHGKSTTVAMLDAIFSHAKVNPTVLSGAELPAGQPFKIGSSGLLIYEACEYRDSFLKFSPTISIGLNSELDHTDYFESLDQLKQSFARALGRAKRFALINGDDINLGSIIPKLRCSVITFGSGEKNDYRYSVTSFREGGFDFTVSRFGSVIGEFSLNIPGAFNVSNATAAIVTALEYGIDTESIAEALSLYRGIPCRLQLMGHRFGRPVYCDYAHHPTEISASINALKMHTRQPLTVVFKPHTFSRTAAFWHEFCSSLSLADYAVITDIYPAREELIEGITAYRLAEDIGSGAVYSTDENAINTVDTYTAGVIVLMGAGDFGIIKKNILTT